MTKITITDHAIVRYLERIKGFDLDPIRAEIEKLVRNGASVDAKRVVVGNSWFCLRGDWFGNEGIVVSTVMDRNEQKDRKVIIRSEAELRRNNRKLERRKNA